MNKKVTEIRLTCYKATITILNNKGESEISIKVRKIKPLLLTY